MRLRAELSKTVSASWIMNLLQARKITTDTARGLLIQCCNASRWLKELDLLEEEQERQAVEAAVRSCQEALASKLHAWKTFKEVDAWLQQYHELLHRYKFLVLDGPSRMGKTVFARTLVDEGYEVLELNCAAGHEPDLRAYRLRKHGLILFDEIEAQAVLRQRKLFQACAAPVQLGCSATNCHRYSVVVHRKKLVLAPNRWEGFMKGMGDEDVDWLKKNSFVLRVSKPLWQDD